MKNLVIIIISIILLTSSCQPFRYNRKGMGVVIMESDTGTVECGHNDSYRVIYQDDNGKWHREWFHEWQVAFIRE